MSTPSQTLSQPRKPAPQPPERGRPSLARLWLVELRKLLDTTTGILLFAATALVAGVFAGGTALFLPDVDYGMIAQVATIPSGVLVPVMAVLLVTSERTHRTALSTYALVPARSRILRAKLLAVVTLTAAVTALTLLLSAVFTAAGPLVAGRQIPWTIDSPSLGWVLVSFGLTTLSGYALGLLTGNAPAAITIVLAWPPMAMMLSIVPRVADVTAWLDLSAVTLFSDGITGAEVARAVTGVVFWVLVPGMLGALRELRAEVR